VSASPRVSLRLLGSEEWAAGHAASAGQSNLLALNVVEEAVVRTLAYADVFGFPLDLEEVVRYCMAPAGTRDEILNAVEGLLDRGIVEAHGRYRFLFGRRSTVFTRRHLARSSEQGWRVARRWASVIWMLPFVRMVAVTGSLAANALGEEHDIDFMIAVQPGRLWITRALCLLVWRVARLAGVRLCPNYYVTTDALTFTQRDLYTARKLAQMAPLHGRNVASQLWLSNRWCLDFLPNAFFEVALTSDGHPRGVRALKHAAERLLAGSLVDRLEVWERERKIARLSADAAGTPESMFSASVCKDHSHAHGSRVRDLYIRRITVLTLQPKPMS
jgi:hypothetical protein